jgi:hypothetical protein
MITAKPDDLPPPVPPEQKLALTISEFCALHGISEARYYALKRHNLAPVEIRVGGTIRISREAAAAWRQARENPTGDEAKAVAADRKRLLDRSHRAASGREVRR